MTSAKECPLVVIGCGLPRTGTFSLHLALTRLLGSECYHMKTVMEGGKEQWTFWDRALKRQLTRKVQKSILKTVFE